MARLDRLLNEVDVFDRPLDARKYEITSITDDTREVRAGTLFCCVVGESVDRHTLAAEAVERGAVALVIQKDVNIDVPIVRVSDVRAAMAPIAAAFYDHPDRHLRLAAITGTNGKTTTAHLLAAILRQHRWKTATIGTLTGRYTSPPPQELQRVLAKLRDEKNQAVVMEVSSHALVQHRVDAVRFAVGVFTNLTQDHLDYHKTMNRYFEAKAILFDPGRVGRAVVNVDDAYGKRLIERLAVANDPYGIADAKDLEMTGSGSRFVWNGEQINLPLVGKFNVYNALAAATAAKVLGISPIQIASALANATSAPGRMESVDRGQPFKVIVDFAHTPDGLDNVLSAVRPIAAQRDGKVIVVFGCGGDKDRDKRSQMGEIAERLADHVVVTTDNSRSEDPQVIAEAVLSGTTRSDRIHLELDRRAAIQLAIENANPGDVVLIAGKGHEMTQDVGERQLPFDDRAVAADAIDALSKRGPQ